MSTAAKGLEAALAPIRARLGRAAGEEPASPAPPRGKQPPSPLDHLAKTFGLSAFERDVIGLAALPALDAAAAELIGRLQDNGRLSLPTIGLALSLLPGGAWSAFAPDGTLRRHLLIELGEAPLASARPLQLPDRLLHLLAGLDTLDETLAAQATTPLGEPIQTKAQTALAAAIAARLGEAITPPPMALLAGSDRLAAIAVAGTAAEGIGRRAVFIPAESLPANAAERARFARLWSREIRLGKSLPVVDAHDLPSGPEQAQAMRFAASIDGPVLLLAVEPLQHPLRAAEPFQLPEPSAADQAELWRQQLGATARPLADAITAVAAHFVTPPALVADIAAGMKREAATLRAAKSPAAASREALEKHLWRETRDRTRPRLDDLAQRLDCRTGWDDLILPERQFAILRTVAAQVRQRARVHEEWGFTGTNGRGLGVSALFAGPSGTGKTLAAEVIGAALELDVYRIDLSSIVSKWLGETEKNLRRLFDAAERTSSILLFDESEALFAKRSEVRDSHDRYANTEISYLLQRMEAYRGLAILTTNLRSHLDPAFMRRLRFVVDFPFPGEAERRRIWEIAFRNDAPREGLDFTRLAQLNVPGGAIRNVALNAAFLAAEAGEPISMRHVRQSVRAEYEKLGKPLTDSEFRGWAPEVVRG